MKSRNYVVLIAITLLLSLTACQKSSTDSNWDKIEDVIVDASNFIQNGKLELFGGSTVVKQDCLPIDITMGNTAFIDTEGSLWMWGDNSYGQLGNGMVTPDYTPNSPTKIMDDVVSVSCGSMYTAAIKKDHSLWMWGANLNGQFGNDDEDDQMVGNMPIQTYPVKVLDDVVSVSCGENHTAAIKSDGTLWVWGSNQYGQLGKDIKGNTIVERGSGEDYPIQSTPIQLMDHVVAVSCGGFHTAAIRSDGSLWTWGSNIRGELGNDRLGDETDVGYYHPTPVKIMKDVIAVNASVDCTAAVKSDGSLWLWGDTCFGAPEEGRGQGYSTTPVKVMDNVTSVSLAGSCVAVIKEDHSLWTWGSQNQGQLGTDSLDVHESPIKILDDVSNAKITYRTAYAIKSDGSIFLWGDGFMGTMGNGFNTTTYTSPVPIEELLVGELGEQLRGKLLDDTISSEETTFENTPEYGQDITGYDKNTERVENNQPVDNSHSDPPSTTNEYIPEETVEPVIPSAPTWDGVYTCNNGGTDGTKTLTITQTSDTTLSISLYHLYADGREDSLDIVADIGTYNHDQYFASYEDLKTLYFTLLDDSTVDVAQIGVYPAIDLEYFGTYTSNN